MKYNIEEIRSIEEKIVDIEQDRDQLADLKDALKHFAKIVSKNIEREIHSNSVVTMRTLISKINVGYDNIIISNRFNDLQKGAG